MHQRVKLYERRYIVGISMIFLAAEAFAFWVGLDGRRKNFVTWFNVSTYAFKKFTRIRRQFSSYEQNS